MSPFDRGRSHIRTSHRILGPILSPRTSRNNHWGTVVIALLNTRWQSGVGESFDVSARIVHGSARSESFVKAAQITNLRVGAAPVPLAHKEPVHLQSVRLSICSPFNLGEEGVICPRRDRQDRLQKECRWNEAYLFRDEAEKQLRSDWRPAQ